MKTIKISYSLMKAWSEGRYDQALSMYRGGSIPITPAIELGRIKDEVWNNHVLRTGTIHPELGGGQVESPLVQQKYEKILPLNDKYQLLLRGVPDMIDGQAIYDWKCGLTAASQYIEKEQMQYYKLLVPKANIGYYLCFNPYFGTLSKGVQFLGSKDAEAALRHIYTYIDDFIAYLIMEKSLVDYRPDIYVQKTIQPAQTLTTPPSKIRGDK